MNWSQLSLQAYILAVRGNHATIINDIPYLNEAELIGLITFIIQLQDN